MQSCPFLSPANFYEAGANQIKTYKDKAWQESEAAGS